MRANRTCPPACSLQGPFDLGDGGALLLLVAGIDEEAQRVPVRGVAGQVGGELVEVRAVDALRSVGPAILQALVLRVCDQDSRRAVEREHVGLQATEARSCVGHRCDSSHVGWPVVWVACSTRWPGSARWMHLTTNSSQSSATSTSRPSLLPSSPAAV